MNRPTQIIRAALVIVGLLQTNALLGQDWPQFRGPNRDNRVTGFKVPEKWPTELAQQWKTEVGFGDASPVLVGDKLYVFARKDTDEVLYCLNANTGEIVWQDKYSAPTIGGAAGRHPGPRGTPAAADGKVCALGVGGVLTCWDANTGAVLWKKDSQEFSKAWPKFYTGMSPLVVDGLCIAHLGTEGNGALVAFDLTTGDEKWRWNGDGPSYGSPVVMTVDGTKQVVSHTEKLLVGVSLADGTLLWQIPFEANQGNTGTPIVDGDVVIYSGQGKGTVAAQIKKDGDAFRSEQLWATPSPSPRFTSPVLRDGYLYGATSTGNLYCMDAKTGKMAWTDSTRRGDPAGILNAGPVLLALTSNSELAAIEPNETEYKELAKIKVSESPTWASPVVAGNRVYIKDGDSVTLWKIE